MSYRKIHNYRAASEPANEDLAVLSFPPGYAPPPSLDLFSKRQNRSVKFTLAPEPTQKEN